MGLSIVTIPWAIWTILLPLAGSLLCFLLPRRAVLLGLATALSIVVPVAGLGWLVATHGVQRYTVGGWGAPLGIDLYADGLSSLMLIMTAMVGLGISLHASSYFEHRKAPFFWPLWLFLWAALNALFLSGDIFNLYVTLELLGLAAVALVALAGGADALTGAMRYLLVSLLGSLCFLLGVALLYHAFGSLDIISLGRLMTPMPAVWAAMGLMTAGLLLKTALFPLHFWLPPAHASAPAPVSAILSALVVKASFYLLLRLWLDLFPEPGVALRLLLGVLGAGAILWGSLLALRQKRLKLLVAYSTVAQLGYLFLAFPLLIPAAWNAVVYFVLSHALAKSAMFLAVGNILYFGGHDRIADLDRIVQRLPLTLTAFAVAGISIIGLPPSGGFVAKWLLLEAAFTTGQWGWIPVVISGSLLATAYVFKVIGFAFTQAKVLHDSRAVPPIMEWAALGLALAALALGLMAPWPLELMDIGAPWVTRIGEGRP